MPNSPSPENSGSVSNWIETVYQQLTNPDFIAEEVSSIIFGLLIVTIFSILGFKKGFLRKIKNIFGKYSAKSFPKRSEHFKCLQSNRSTDGVPPPRDHLIHRCLWGKVPKLAVYGRFNTTKTQVKYVPLEETKASIKDKETLKFLKKCIVNYRVNNEEENTVEEQTHGYLATRLLTKVLNHKGRPQLAMVTGKVGCGKSTLLSSLGFMLARQNSFPTKVAYLLVDLRLLLTTECNLTELFDKAPSDAAFADKIVDIVKTEIVHLLFKYRIGSIQTDTDLDAALEECYRRGVSVIVALDEFDYLYTEFSKRVITKKGRPLRLCAERYQRLFDCLCSMHLDLPQPPTTSNANVAIIVTARSSTLKFIEDLAGEQETVISIKLQEAPNESVAEMVMRQVNIVAKQPWVNTKDKKLLDDFSIRLKSGDIDYTKNLKVSVHGVRHLINAIAKLVDRDLQIANTSQYALLTQIASQPSLLRLFQYIDGNPDYSQACEGISNIYLVNRDPVFYKSISDINETDNHTWLFGDHLQSYWLKYFLCQYIVKNHHEPDNILQFDDIVDAFSHTGTPGVCRYEESIVKLALLHASKVDHGRLIKFGFDQGVTVRPASRLLYLINNNLFWDFGYLMVAIEDKWLEHPINLFQSMMRKDRKTVFDFVTRFHISTEEEKISFITHKTEQVLRFFLILKGSLESEHKRYSDVFHDLEKINIDINPMDKFYTHLNKSIINFSEKYVGEKCKAEVKKTIVDFESGRAVVFNEIRENFKHYHDMPLFQSMSTRMARYHESREIEIA